MSDQNAGMGGSYVLDPKTGERRLMERTNETTEPAQAGFLTPVPVAPADTTTTTTE